MKVQQDKLTSNLTNEQQTTNNQTTNNQQHRKNVKNVKKEKNKDGASLSFSPDEEQERIKAELRK